MTRPIGVVRSGEGSRRLPRPLSLSVIRSCGRVLRLRSAHTESAPGSS